jgi:hypothetical protein
MEGDKERLEKVQSSVADPGPFLPWILDPGWVKSQDPDPG